MWIVKRIQKHLAEGYEVILRKDSDGAHQVSYSRVVRIEGTHLRRTMFEATSVAETYNYEVGKYTTKWIEENYRVSFFWKGKSLSKYTPDECCTCDDRDDDDDYINEELNDDDDDDECTCCAEIPSRAIGEVSLPRNWRLKKITL